MKKLIVFIIIIIAFCCLFSVNAGAKEIDFSKLDESLAGTENFFEEKNLVQKILDNEFSLDGKSILENVCELLFTSLKSYMPLFCVLLGILIVISILKNLELLNTNIDEAAMLGGRIIFCLTLYSGVIGAVTEAKTALEGVKGFTEALSPILITLLSACGAQGSVAAFSPILAFLSSTLISVICYFVLPLIFAGCIVSSVNTALPDGILSGVNRLFKSVTSWVIGGIFSLFSAVVSIQGLIANVRDGISIKGIKYAISTAVPIIGGAVSESFSMVLASSYYLKSAAGIMGIIVILGILILPLVNLVGLILLLKMFCACVEPFSDKQILSQVNNVCEFLKLTAITVLGVCVLWLVFLGIFSVCGGSIL